MNEMPAPGGGTRGRPSPEEDETPHFRVLVVDDEAAVRALHCRYVAAAHGFTVVASVGTGRAALAAVSAGGIDLILLDMRLPDISGVEVLNRLRTLGDVSPDVLVISSSRDQVTVRQALAAHVTGYLVKPFTEDTLKERLAIHRADRASEVAAERPIPLGQGEIDRLLAGGGGRGGAPGTSGAPPADGAASGAALDQQRSEHVLVERLPKGLAEVTLRRVLAALDPARPSSARDVSAHCSISRATARRYLDHLVETGSIHLSHRYGRRGRPEVLYRLTPAAPQST